MARRNPPAKELVCNLVYWGPPQAGKSQHLAWLAANAPPGCAGRLLRLAAETERALLFEFLPLALGPIGGFATRFHLYSVPEQAGGAPLRRALAREADAIVFVADARSARLDANLAALEELQQVRDPRTPWVLAANHADAADATSLQALCAALGVAGVQARASCATDGTAVWQVLHDAARAALVAAASTLAQTG